jgi:hypothetical protein
MSDDLKEVLTKIGGLDEKIDSLQDDRDALTYPLEQAAMQYRRENGVSGILGCSRCYFVFAGTQNEDTVISFGTDCSWCGPNGREMRVPVSELARYLGV